jgi:hypothetical protein
LSRSEDLTSVLAVVVAVVVFGGLEPAEYEHEEADEDEERAAGETDETVESAPLL